MSPPPLSDRFAIDPESTRALLPYAQLIPAVGGAFDEPPTAPARAVLAGAHADWIVMPGLTSDDGMLCKLLRVGRGDDGVGAATIAGLVCVFAPDGSVRLLLDGGTLTARRTAAIAAYATDLLARPDAGALALFGTGSLAEEHVEAIDAVRPLRAVRAFGRSRERAESFRARLAARGFEIELCRSPRETLAGADIVACVTTAEEPVFADEELGVGVHVNAMGSYKPERSEVPAETVARALVVVETRETAWEEAGDLIQPLEAGLIGAAHVRAEIRERELVARLRAEAPEALTLFKSVGHVALDVAAVGVALRGLSGDLRVVVAPPAE